MVVNAKALFGENVKYGKKTNFRFIVSIMEIPDLNHPFSQLNHICTGTLITLRDVATSAQCVSGYTVNSLKVVAGSNDLRKSESYHISWWITYDDWAKHYNIKKKFDNHDVLNIRVSFTSIFSIHLVVYLHNTYEGM
jgi:hypothetical protein